jgi:hypothetical protein
MQLRRSYQYMYHWAMYRRNPNDGYCLALPLWGGTGPRVPGGVSASKKQVPFDFAQGRL